MTASKIILAHRQIYQKSCPASVMELVAKLHGKIEADKFPFQDKYKETPIGFSKLFELDNLGLKTRQSSLPPKDAWNFCERENGRGLFPLVSLPTESRKSFFDGIERIAEDSNHIFITVLNPQLTLVCHGYNLPQPLPFSNIAEISQRILGFDQKFLVNVVTYSL